MGNVCNECGCMCLECCDNAQCKKAAGCATCGCGMSKGFIEGVRRERV